MVTCLNHLYFNIRSMVVVLVSLYFMWFTLYKATTVQRNDTYPTIFREKSRAVVSCTHMHSVNILLY